MKAVRRRRAKNTLDDDRKETEVQGMEGGSYQRYYAGERGWSAIYSRDKGGGIKGSRT